MGRPRYLDASRVPVRDPENAPEGPGVYFLQCAQTGLVKIGVAANIRARVVDIDQECPTLLIYLGAVKAGRELESALHRQLAKYRVHGEWFSPSDAVLSELRRRGCQPLLHLKAPGWLSVLRQSWDGYGWTDRGLAEFTELRQAFLEQARRSSRHAGWVVQARKRLADAEALQQQIAELVNRCRADLESKAATSVEDDERRRRMRLIREEYESLSPEERARRWRESLERLAKG